MEATFAISLEKFWGFSAKSSKQFLRKHWHVSGSLLLAFEGLNMRLGSGNEWAVFGQVKFLEPGAGTYLHGQKVG